MKKIALLLGFLSIFAADCSQGLNKNQLSKDLANTEFELYTYVKRAEHLQQIVDASQAAHTVQVYLQLIPETIYLRPRKKTLQTKKRYQGEEKQYLFNLEQMNKKLREANLELSQMPEYQELELAKKEIEALKEKVQEILVMLQQCKK